METKGLTSLSASRIKTFKMCLFKYFMNYVLDPRVDLGTNWGACHGTAIHNVLEAYANGDRDWKKNLLAEYLLVDKRYNKRLLQQAKPGDYTKPRPLHKCLTAGCEHYMDGICAIEGVEVEKLSGCGRLLYGASVRLMEKFLASHGDVYDKEIVGVELDFRIEFEPGKHMRGYIDFAYKDDGVIHMIDYKTGRKWEPSQNEQAIKEDIQAQMYAVALDHLYPDTPTILTFHFFMNRPITVWYTPAEIAKIRYNLSKTWDEIARFHEEFEVAAERIRDGQADLPKICKFLCKEDICDDQWEKFRKAIG